MACRSHGKQTAAASRLALWPFLVHSPGFLLAGQSGLGCPSGFLPRRKSSRCRGSILARPRRRRIAIRMRVPPLPRERSSFHGWDTQARAGSSPRSSSEVSDARLGQDSPVGYASLFTPPCSIAAWVQKRCTPALRKAPGRLLAEHVQTSSSLWAFQPVTWGVLTQGSSAARAFA